jgi:hypothetical protein
MILCPERDWDSITGRKTRTVRLGVGSVVLILEPTSFDITMFVLNYLDGSSTLSSNNVLVGMVGCWICWQIMKRALKVYRSPLRALPGPSSPSIILGNLYQLMGREMRGPFREWHQTYGHTYAINTLFGVSGTHPAMYSIITVLICSSDS